MDSIPQITCTRCGETFPATAEHFYKKASGKHGLFSWCKPCCSVRRREYRKANVEHVRERHRQRRKKHAEKERERKQRWRQNNPEKILEYQRRWYRQNPEKTREYREANAEHMRERRQHWRQNNPEKEREHRRRWYINNPDKAREKSRRRRARKANLPFTFTVEHEHLALDYFNGCCAVCERPLRDLFGTHTIHFDHWIPLSKGGGTTPDNMVPLCGGIGGCNNRKNDSNPVEWLQSRFGKRKAVEILTRIQAYFDSVK